MEHAYIHPNAKIGKNVTIDPFTYIAGDVVIGDNTWVGPNVNIMDGARIGNNCRIFPGAVISAIPQDLKFHGEITTAEIGNNTTIRECVTINRGTTDKMKTVIGDNCLIMAYCHIAHDCTVGKNCIFSNNSTLAGHTTVGDYVILAGMAAVHQFCSIGNHSFVTGGSLVRKDVPPYVKAAREPLSYVGINSVGLRRRGYTDEQVREIEDIYRTIYVQNSNLSKGVDAVLQSMDKTPLRDEIIGFIQASDKGVIRGMV